MVLFNYSTKEITAKIVYYGPGLCGKTTNLQFVYENLPQAINKGKMLSLATKTDRTLFFDFLPIDLGTIRGMRTRLQLYTVPGQVFYNTTRKLVLKGADGVVFVADSQERMIDANLESFKNLEENLAEHDMRLGEMPLIIQFNKRDLPDVGSIEELNAAINRFNAPIYEAVATTGIGVHETLKAITRLVLNSLKERYADKREQRAEPPANVAAMMAAAAAKTATAAPPQAEARTIAVNAPSQEPMPSHSMPPFSPPARPEEVASFSPPAEPFPAIDLGPPLPPEAPALDFAPPLPLEAPALDFTLPELEENQEFEEPEEIEEPVEIERVAALAVEIPPVRGVEPFAPEESAVSEAPLDLMMEPESESILDVMPAEETDLLIEIAVEEDVLELVEEEPLAGPPQVEERISTVAAPLEVTEEIFQMEEPPPREAPAEEVYEPIPLAEEEAEKEDASAESGFPSDDFLEPIEATGPYESSSFALVEAVVFEDQHDDGLFLGGLTQDAPGAVPPLEEGPVSPIDLAQEGSGLDMPILPLVPLAPTEEVQPEVRAVSVTPLAPREIHLPIRLEIGGQSIGFELKISLDLTGAAHGSRQTAPEEGGIL